MKHLLGSEACLCISSGVVACGAGTSNGGGAGGSVAQGVQKLLGGRLATLFAFGFIAVACSADDSPRCAADLSLAQACAAGGCPRDLQAAIAAGKACDSSFPQLWQDGDLRAVGLGTGFDGVVYHFDGDQLVGREAWTDVLGDCPISYVNGRRTVDVHGHSYDAEAPAPKECALCPDWAVDDERPVCP